MDTSGRSRRTKQNWRPFFKSLGAAVLVVICLYAAAGGVLYFMFDGEYGEAGVFGDSFGAVNALFSALALAAVAATLIQSQRQLQIQQEELEQNTQMLKEQRDEMKAQNEFNARREFQTTFFDMLRALQDTVRLIAVDRKVEIDPNNPPMFPQPERWVHGRSALRILGWELKSHMENGLMNEAFDESDDEAFLNAVNSVYASFYMKYGDLLGHYFRMMYQIARYIRDEAEKSQTDPRPFVRILRAQLSQSEMVLLFYNCLSIHGYEKFHPLVERYDLLQNMERSSVPVRQWDLYPVTSDSAPPAEAPLRLNARAQRLEVANSKEPIRAEER